MTFIQFLKLLKENSKYIDPNKIYLVKGEICFIFNEDNSFFYEINGVHIDLIMNHSDYYLGFPIVPYYSRTPEMYDIAGLFWEKMQKGSFALFGRMSESSSIISFWNTNIKAYKNLLLNCLNTIHSTFKAKGLGIHRNFEISAPIFGTVNVMDLLSNLDFYLNHSLESEELENIQKAGEMHLKAGEEKRRELLKRGVRPKEKYKNLSPGQKWWALSSESFKYS